MSLSATLNTAGRSRQADEQPVLKGRGNDHLPNATHKDDEDLEMAVAFGSKEKVSDLDKSSWTTANA